MKMDQIISMIFEFSRFDIFGSPEVFLETFGKFFSHSKLFFFQALLKKNEQQRTKRSSLMYQFSRSDNVPGGTSSFSFWMCRFLKQRPVQWPNPKGDLINRSNVRI